MDPTPNTFDQKIAESCFEFANKLRLQYPELRGVVIGLAYQKNVNTPDLARHIFCTGTQGEVTVHDAHVNIDITNGLLNSAVNITHQKVNEFVQLGRSVLLSTRDGLQEASHAPRRQTEETATHGKEQGQKAYLEPHPGKAEAVSPAGEARN